MVVQNVAFWILAVAMAGAAIGVVRSQNVVHAALYLVVVLAGVAAEFILLVAEFVAWVQVLIYIGAVVILFLFGIMLTRAPMRGDTDLDNDQRWPAAVVVDLPSRGDHHTRRRRVRADQKIETVLAGGKVGDWDSSCNFVLTVRSRVDAAARVAGRRSRDREEGLTMIMNQFLILAGVPLLHRCLRRARASQRCARAHERRAHAQRGQPQPGRVLRLPPVSGQVFALFIITIAAAEVGVGLAIVLLIYRNLRSPDLDNIDQLKG